MLTLVCILRLLKYWLLRARHKKSLQHMNYATGITGIERCFLCCNFVLCVYLSCVCIFVQESPSALESESDSVVMDPPSSPVSAQAPAAASTPEPASRLGTSRTTQQRAITGKRKRTKLDLHDIRDAGGGRAKPGPARSACPFTSG